MMHNVKKSDSDTMHIYKILVPYRQHAIINSLTIKGICVLFALRTDLSA